MNTDVVAAVPLSLQMSQAPNTSHHTVLENARQRPQNHDAMLAAHLSEIHACPFYGLHVEYISGSAGGAPQPTHNCQVAVALARSTQKSRCMSTAHWFLVSTGGVVDALEDEESDKVEVRGYCSVDNLLDFRMGPPARAK